MKKLIGKLFALIKKNSKIFITIAVYIVLFLFVALVYKNADIILLGCIALAFGIAFSVPISLIAHYLALYITKRRYPTLKNKVVFKQFEQIVCLIFLVVMAILSIIGFLLSRNIAFMCYFCKSNWQKHGNYACIF